MAPRVSASSRKPKSLSPSVPTRSGPAPMGDNSLHGEEAERVQLISIVSQLSAAEDEIEVAKAPLKAAQAKRSKIIDLGKAAGFTAKELQKRLDEMQKTDAENAPEIARETRHRRWLGITSDEQQKIHLGDSTPREAMDEHDWQARGYRVGLLGGAANLPEGIPPRMDQFFLKGHGTGYGEYMAALEANAPKAPASVRDQAAADFAEDNKPEPGSPEAAAAERKAVRQARAGLDKLADREPPADPDVPFEATAEELAAQKPRLVVQNAVLKTEEEEPV